MRKVYTKVNAYSLMPLLRRLRDETDVCWKGGGRPAVNHDTKKKIVTLHFDDENYWNHWFLTSSDQDKAFGNTLVPPNEFVGVIRNYYPPTEKMHNPRVEDILN